MPLKITKLKSLNLLGETEEEERRRLIRVRREMILAGASPIMLREMKITRGASPEQLQRRRNILKGARLSTKSPKYRDFFVSSKR